MATSKMSLQFALLLAAFLIPTSDAQCKFLSAMKAKMVSWLTN
jgi:hypothetical protein